MYSNYSYTNDMQGNNVK